MRIVELQASLRERGRIRLGYSTPGKKAGTKVPHKSDKFRFTAATADILAPVAELYGGEVTRWVEGDARNHFQLTAEATRIPVIYPSAMGLSQSYDQYAKGFHTLTCDSQHCRVPGSRVERACQCDPLERTCQLTTQLSLVLPEVPGLGVWRLVTHGNYAARELLGHVHFIEQAIQQAGVRVPAVLGLEQREIRRLVDGKPVTFQFVVPTLDIEATPAALSDAIAAHPSSRGLPRPESSAVVETQPHAVSGGWRPVDTEALSAGPPPDLAEAFAQNERAPQRTKRSRPALGASGATPAAAACALCNEPLGAEPVVRNPSGGKRYVHRRCAETTTHVEQPTLVDDDASDESTTSTRELPMSHAQHAKLFALANDVLADLSDAERKAEMLAMASAVGAAGLTSRTQFNSTVASALIDKLAAVQHGQLVWIDGRFEAPL